MANLTVSISIHAHQAIYRRTAEKISSPRSWQQFFWARMGHITFALRPAQAWRAHLQSCTAWRLKGSSHLRLAPNWHRVRAAQKSHLVRMRQVAVRYEDCW